MGNPVNKRACPLLSGGSPYDHEQFFKLMEVIKPARYEGNISPQGKLSYP